MTEYKFLDYANGYVGEWIRGHFPDGYIGHAIDVGASDGYSVNTTFHLERAHHWTVLSVEANPNFAPLLRKSRTWIEMCACGAEPRDEAMFHINVAHPEAYSALNPNRAKANADGNGAKTKWEATPVKVRTIDQLIEKWQFPKLDALCVDVEGDERDVLMGCDLVRWKPKVIVSEAWESGHEYPYLATFGYKLKARSADNDLYVLEDQ